MTAWLAFGATVQPLAQEASGADRLKAAFLSRFPQFVEWPATALAGRASLDVCVLTPSPFGTVLHDLAEGEQIAGRPLRPRVVTREGMRDCHVLYVPAALDGRRTLLERLKGQPVLTVSDADGFLDDGGVVQLRLVGNRVRFHIDAGTAERAGLRLSAQLLRLAVSVRGGRS
jgi:hypothetical protein